MRITFHTTKTEFKRIIIIKIGTIKKDICTEIYIEKYITLRFAMEKNNMYAAKNVREQIA